MFGEHRSPFRDPPLLRARFDKKTSVAPQGGTCADSDFRGRSRLPELDIPRFAGTPGPPSRRVSCFWGFVLQLRRESPDAGFRLFSIRVNADASEGKASMLIAGNDTLPFARSLRQFRQEQQRCREWESSWELGADSEKGAGGGGGTERNWGESSLPTWRSAQPRGLNPTDLARL